MPQFKFTGISHVAFGNKSYLVPENGLVEIEPEVAGNREFITFCETINHSEGTSVEMIDEPETAPVEIKAPKANAAPKVKPEAKPETAPVEG